MNTKVFIKVYSNDHSLLNHLNCFRLSTWVWMEDGSLTRQHSPQTWVTSSARGPMHGNWFTYVYKTSLHLVSRMKYYNHRLIVFDWRRAGVKKVPVYDCPHPPYNYFCNRPYAKYDKFLIHFEQLFTLIIMLVSW